MNWIQVVYFKLKHIWPLFAPAKAKRTGSFFNESKSQSKFGLVVSSNDNYFTEELVNILWIEIKLFISNWKRFDLYLPLLKLKNRACFLLPFRQIFEWKHEISANLTFNNMNSVHKIPTSSSVKQFSLGDNFKVKFISYQSLNVWYAGMIWYVCILASLVPVFSADDRVAM